MIKDLSGIIIVDKPSGVGSFQVIRQLRKTFRGFPKAGFLGTLDPMATGVLPLFLGASTKLIPYIKADPKIYRMKIEFGKATDSYDATGKVTEDIRVAEGMVTEEKVADCIPGFTGVISQSPPPLSACKVNGKRAYAHFFEGKPVQPAARDKQIIRIEMTGFQPGDYPVAELVVSCESGTYMRSLAVDIGKKLSVPANLLSLCRLAGGEFLISESVSLDQLLEGELEKYILSADRFLDFPEIIISRDSKLFSKVKNGNPLRNHWKVPGGLVKIKDSSLNLLAIFRSDGSMLRSEKILV